MKKYTLIAALIFSTAALKAQTWSEWFDQKDTQIKYLREQIAALKVYGDYTLKGYRIAKEGLAFIYSIKQGDFTLHQDYFSSLSRVNPKIKDYRKVADIVSLSQEIMKVCQRHKTLVDQSGMFSPEEVGYFKKVFENLLDDCTGLIEQLTRLTTDSTLELKDDERLNRIDGLYTDMQDKYAFARDFSLQAARLAIQRQHQKGDVSSGRLLYGIH
jgi:hypothetical protein